MTPSRFVEALDAHQRMIAAMHEQQAQIETLIAQVADVLDAGGKLLIAGNGGSAAQAQHLAAELMVRFRDDRRPLPALALTADTVLLSAHVNDYGPRAMFARQLQALSQPQDLFVALTTSGESENIVAALQSARDCGLTSLLLTGDSDSRARQLADRVWAAPGQATARIQEAHQLFIHLLCETLEARLLDRVSPP